MDVDDENMRYQADPMILINPYSMKSFVTKSKKERIMILTHTSKSTCKPEMSQPKLCFHADWHICIQVGLAQVTPLVK